MSRPDRGTSAGRAYLELRRRARADGRSTDELLVLYVLERFLYRVALSPHRQRLVLKGGLLLAALDERRPTRDVDLLALSLGSGVDEVVALVAAISLIEVDDGVAFRSEAATGRLIREQDAYAAVRVTVPATVASAELSLKVDINVGDPISPAPVEVLYPALLDAPFTLVGYPIETVLAEKLVTMIDRGDANTRDRDFADVWLLTRRHRVDAPSVRAAIVATAAHRDVTLRPIAQILITLASDRGVAWGRYLERAGLDEVPRTLPSVIADIVAFADPLLTGEILEASWDPLERRWSL
jgi:predicted nucleotidyltransferase component of viral defense system